MRWWHDADGSRRGAAIPLATTGNANDGMSVGAGARQRRIGLFDRTLSAKERVRWRAPGMNWRIAVLLGRLGQHMWPMGGGALVIDRKDARPLLSLGEGKQILRFAQDDKSAGPG